MDKDDKGMRNDARQSSADRPAFGARAEDFGAGGQTIANTQGGTPERDLGRDPKLAEAGETAGDDRRETQGGRT